MFQRRNHQLPNFSRGPYEPCGPNPSLTRCSKKSVASSRAWQDKGAALLSAGWTMQDLAYTAVQRRLAADLASASAAHRDALRAAAERRRRAVRSLLAERRARYQARAQHLMRMAPAMHAFFACGQANAPAHSEPPLPILLGHESRECRAPATARRVDDRLQVGSPQGQRFS